MIVFIGKLIVPKKVFGFQLQDRWSVGRDGLIVCLAHNNVYFYAWMYLSIIHKAEAMRHTGVSWR